MSLHIIPSNISNLPAAQRKIIENLKNLYSDSKQKAYLYQAPKIKNLLPNFILITSRGVLIINLSDIKSNDIINITRKEIHLRNGKKENNPTFKNNQIVDLCKGLFNSEDRLFDEDGIMKVNISSIIFFTNMSNDQLEKRSKFFSAENTILVSNNMLSNFNINQIFNNQNSLDDNSVRLIRSMLFPEIKITDQAVSINENHDDEYVRIVKALDEEQEQFAKRVPYGHYMVTGVPGSGKTVMLLARALYIVKEHPDWKVLIVTYNKSLASRLENRIKSFEEDYKFMDIQYQNIIVKTFSKLALDISNTTVPYNATNEFWTKTLCSAALQNASPSFDAILVDEYQDFYDDWIRLCVKLSKPHNYENSTGQKTTGINLFLAGDRLQSIYNEREQSFAQLGINMQGRSKLLKTTYRTGKQHINLALDFLIASEELKNEVEKFYEGRTGIDNNTNIANRVEFIEGNYNLISKLVDDLIFKANYNESEILLLCVTNSDRQKVYDALTPRVKSNAIVSKEMVEGKLTITTYFSSKGLEGSICILCDTDKLPLINFEKSTLMQRKLIYVGMTRATKTLYIHGNNFRLNSFGKEIKQISKEIIK